MLNKPFSGSTTFMAVWAGSGNCYNMIECCDLTYERRIAANFDELDAEKNRDLATKCAASLNEAAKAPEQPSMGKRLMYDDGTPSREYEEQPDDCRAAFEKWWLSKYPGWSSIPNDHLTWEVWQAAWKPERESQQPDAPTYSDTVKMIERALTVALPYIKRAREANPPKDDRVATLDDYAHGLVECAIKLLPSLRPIVRESGWQPISTAPKDGTEILCWGDWQHYPFRICSWATDIGKPNKPQLWHWTTENRALINDPTHWMPLPKPPTNQTEGGE